jgi:hypothetical protein
MQAIRQVAGQERITQQRGLAWLMACLYLGRSPHIERIANKIAGPARKRSKGERLRRWLDNPAVKVRRWYDPVARQLLAAACAEGRTVRLIIDGTRLGNDHQLLLVALAYRRRALPISWTWVRCQMGHSRANQQAALLAHVRGLMPEGTPVQVVGDSEFGAVQVLRLLDGWGWQYALRQTGKHLVQLTAEVAWQPFGHLVTAPGHAAWFPLAQLTLKHAYVTNLLAIWQPGEAQPWLLATNLTTPQATKRLYRCRMWIEELFGDCKSNGFDIQAVRLRHFLRLSRFMLAVALLYVWLIAFGSVVVKRGQRALVDRKDRRTLSLFRIGFDRLERCIINGEAFSFRLLPYF